MSSMVSSPPLCLPAILLFTSHAGRRAEQGFFSASILVGPIVCMILTIILAFVVLPTPTILLLIHLSQISFIIILSSLILSVTLSGLRIYRHVPSVILIFFTNSTTSWAGYSSLLSLSVEGSSVASFSSGNTHKEDFLLLYCPCPFTHSFLLFFLFAYQYLFTHLLLISSF